MRIILQKEHQFIQSRSIKHSIDNNFNNMEIKLFRRFKNKIKYNNMEIKCGNMRLNHWQLTALSKCRFHGYGSRYNLMRGRVLEHIRVSL